MAEPEIKSRVSPIREVAQQLLKLHGAVTLSGLGQGTQLYSPGDPSHHVYVLRSGSVKIYRLGRGGKHCVFGVVEQGEIFGEGALLGEESRRSSAEVLEKASVTMVPSESVKEYAEEQPEFWESFVPFLGRKIRVLEEQVQWLCFLDVEQRLARLLLQWVQAAREAHPAEQNPQIRLSQKELAGLVGATRETTSSALNRLQRAGCIEIGRRRLMVRSMERLAEYARETGPEEEPGGELQLQPEETEEEGPHQEPKAQRAGSK